MTGITKVTTTPDQKTKKKRKCLKCDKEFNSAGVQNRICSTCSINNEILKNKYVIWE